MRRYLFIVLTLVALMAVTTTAAYAASPHFKRGGSPTCTITGGGTSSTSTVCKASLTGLGGGDVTISPTPNADTLNLFKSGDVDGAWLPEPWASRLVLEAGAKVLVDEKDLWPEGKFVTTHLIVRTEFLKQYPDTVAALLRGHVAAVKESTDDATKVKTSVNAALEAAGGKALSAAVLDRAWSELTVTYDPIASALEKSAANGVAAGTTEKEVDLKGIYDLRPLNSVLKDQSLDPVSAGGLGDE